LLLFHKEFGGHAKGAILMVKRSFEESALGFDKGLLASLGGV
jgi:hypothetical protein